MFTNYTDDEIMRESVVSFAVIDEDKNGIKGADNYTTLLEDSLNIEHKERYAVVSCKANGDSTLLGQLHALLVNYLASCFDNASVKQRLSAFFEGDSTCFDLVISPKLHIFCTKESSNVVSYILKDNRGRTGALFCFKKDYDIEKVLKRFEELILDGELNGTMRGR